MNLFSEEMRRNPFAVYDHLRSTSPVLHIPQANAWMIFDYDGVKRALTDHDAFSSSMYVAGRGNPEWFIFFDPRRHTNLRGLIMQAFTPKMVAGLEPRIRKLSRDLIDAAVEDGTMDIAGDFAVPLPMLVIADMLGIPSEDRLHFKRWSDAILNLSYEISGGEEKKKAAVEFVEVTAEMRSYLARLVEDRRRAPKDDLLTRLVEAEVNGERLSEDEILGFFQLLLVAGTETTTNLISNAVLSLLDHPDQFERLRSQPGLLPSAIEEVLRFRSPVQWMFRATRHDVELGGTTIPAGKLVLPVIGSANHDPKHFADPSRFDIGRDPNPHIAFGHGIHFCIGAPLARLEGRIALGELLSRINKLEPAWSGPWEPRKALHVHGPTSLPVRFKPANAADAQA